MRLLTVPILTGRPSSDRSGAGSAQEHCPALQREAVTATLRRIKAVLDSGQFVEPPRAG